MDELLQEFIAETRETLEALAGEIVAWEASPADAGRLDAIFRFVHTVKGSCGFLDLPRLAALSHAAEDVLASARSGKRAPDAILVNAVLAIVDRIGALVEAIAAGTALPDVDDAALIAALAEGAAPAAAPLAATTRTPGRTVRVGVDLLDRMMSGMSEMVLARNELARRLREQGGDPGLEAALERLSTTVAGMRDTVTRTRMQRIEALFQALPRMVRDTAAELGKSVTLHIAGSDVELDREMIELMRDPLLHVVRNAIDHGIEIPAERRAAGKGENGHLRIAARQSGNQILIDITDDGRGIDVPRLLAKVEAAGSYAHDELVRMSPRRQLELVFEPGLSTRDEVTTISGRGVGMDVVRANVEQIGGRIILDSVPGRGLSIQIAVPLTLSIIATIGVAVGSQRFAVPRPSIEEIVSGHTAAVRVDRLAGGAALATIREQRLPLLDLGQALGLGDPQGERNMLVVLNAPGGRYALAVDAVLDPEELVVKPAAPIVMASGCYAGQTLPDTGLPMLLLDPAGLAERAQLQFAPVENDFADHQDARELPRALLFVDLDGERRLVPLAAIDRIEMVPAARVRFAAGTLRMTTGDGGLLPLVAAAPLPDRAEHAVLRLRDGAMELGYVVDRALDIVALSAEMAPAVAEGPVAGAVVIDGATVEMIDLHWLFTTHRGARGDRPLCLLDGPDTSWLATFLAPLATRAGYRVVTRLAAGERPAVTLSLDGAPVQANGPVVRLGRETAPGQIDRYDRTAILAALSAVAVAGAGAGAAA